MLSPESPKEVADRYKITSVLGEGGMGVVYKAYDPVMMRTVAIKMLRHQADERDLIRFQREAKALGKLKSDHIVSISDFGRETDYVSYLVMDYLKGDNLAQLIAEQGPLDLETAVEVLLQLGKAMQYAHNQGVLHRDLKPSNVILTRNDSDELIVKVLDFGLAKLTGEEGITESGIGMGSPPYMAPEQVQGGKVDERSDIYSFGCLMFEVLTGAKAFFASSAAATAQLQLTEDPPGIADIVGDESERLDFQDLVSKCLEKEPEKRYSSFSDLLTDLQLIVEPPESDEPEVIAEKVEDKKFQHMPLLVISLSALALLLTGLVFTHPSLLKEPVKKKPAPREDELERYSKNFFPEQVFGKWDRRANKGEFQPNGHFRQDEVTEAQLLPLRRRIKAKGYPVTALHLDFSDIKGPALRHFRDLPITSLSICNSTISDEGMKFVAMFDKVEYLKLNKDKNITDRGFTHLARMKLVSISLIDTKIGTEGLKALGQMDTLVQINLEGCHDVTAEGLSYLSRLPNLHNIKLNGTEIRREKLHKLAALTSLKRLFMVDTYGYTRQDLAQLKKKLDTTKVFQSFRAKREEQLRYLPGT